jgi:hypothetical protein
MVQYIFFFFIIVHFPNPYLPLVFGKKFSSVILFYFNNNKK